MSGFSKAVIIVVAIIAVAFTVSAVTMFIGGAMIMRDFFELVR